MKESADCQTASLSSLSSRTSGKRSSLSGKKPRKKSAARTEARRAYQRRRNKRKNDDAKRYRELESRIARIEEKIIQDRGGIEVSAESATAAVTSPDLALARASASGSGALRFKSGVSQSVTTSTAESGEVTGLVVDDARVNAVVDTPKLSIGAVPTAPASVARLKLGSRSSVTSTSYSIGDQQQSASGASRLKSGIDLSVPSAARTLHKEADCHLVSMGTDNDMECDVIEVEDGEVDEAVVEEDHKSLEMKERKKVNSEAFTNGRVRVLKQYFTKNIEGKFTNMYAFRTLERTSLNHIEHCFPGFFGFKHKKIDEEEFAYFLDNQNSFIQWRRFYLSREPLIDIDTSTNKEAAYLSALIHLHSFNDCYIRLFVCPCKHWVSRWKYSFCHFEEEIPECMATYNSSTELFDHCKIVGKECRWHYLCYRFMEKVFFKNMILTK